MADGEDAGGLAAASGDIIAQFQTTRVRSLWTNYLRIFQLTKEAIITVDPSNFNVTNSFTYQAIQSVLADGKNSEEFSMDIQKAGKFVFRCTHRNQLLCQLFEQLTKKTGKMKSFGPYRAERLQKNQIRREVKLAAASFGLVELEANSGRILQEYSWVNINRIGVDENTRSFFFLYSGRIKIFFLADLDSFITGCRQQVKNLGLDNIPFISGQNVQDAAKKRMAYYVATGSAVSTFQVNKATKRSPRMMPRQMLITEQYVVEKDSSGFQFVSCHKMSNIYAVVRSWSNPREFTIEYIDGTSRTYNSSVRDTLLALLQDVAHSGGNLRVIVTGEVSDNLRLMPRFAEEVYVKSIKDAFFGPFSIEAWYLKRLQRACCGETFDSDEVVQSCRDLNANVPFPGIAGASDPKIVKDCMVGVLRGLQIALLMEKKNPEVSLSRPISVMLQTLYRILPSSSGYKGFIEIKDIDPRFMIINLLKFNNDFVNYWTLQVLMQLCRCPLTPRNTQVEFVNKHALLIDGVLKCLIELMSSRIVEEEVYNQSDSEDDEETEAICREELDTIYAEKKRIEDQARAEQEAFAKQSRREQEEGYLDRVKNEYGALKASWNEDNLDFLTEEDYRRDLDLMKIKRREERREAREKRRAEKEAADKIAAATVDISGPPPTQLHEEIDEFFPNSLVIVGAATLLESAVCSGRDTSSPELIHKILDILAERPEILVHMLRSPSFLIMENASILMHVLLKNRPETLSLIRDCALSECLVLRQFYNSVFSPSACQRFISRFLCATWMSGDETVDGKKLLRRIIPSGLIEYLKHTPISEDHRRNLDELEEEFYVTYGGATANQSNVGPVAGAVSGQLHQTSADLLSRMRGRLTEALKMRPLREDLDVPDAKPPGNFRIMFHAMTNDHQLPDLIWNEQTRLELRNTLEREFAEFDREQQLKGFRRIAWNYQQFTVIYESLRYEVQVGPIYIRCFLEIGDAFIRDLENPSHGVLFEKMMRRVLVNIDRDPRLAVLCTKCMCRLYEVCKDKIGEFDDMMIVVRMLEDAKVMELQHCVLDLLEQLSLEDSNLQQLLNKDFAQLYLKFCSLAHLNPDQIGNVLARATNKVLMLTDGETSALPTHNSSFVRAGAPAPTSQPVASDGATEKRIRARSQWVPDDAACPRVWFVASYNGKMPPPQNVQRGPFRVTELLQMIDNGSIDENVLAAPSLVEDYDAERFESQVDTGKWRPLKDFFQFRMQVSDPEKAHYSPADVATKAIRTVFRLSSLHKSVNATGIPFFPVPTSKRLFSDLESMGVLAQLLLANDKNVVEIAANMLTTLVEHSLGVASKLYLTGVFYFCCRYTSNNFLTISNLLKASHLRQSFHDGSTFSTVELSIPARSVLGTMLPASLIYVLEKDGPAEFAKIFTGTANNPEVIWSAELRQHVVEMVNAHLGDFPLRLRQFTLGKYDFCPIPPIKYPTLDKELYCHLYYLRNLVDEVRFPNWPIGEPLVVLRDTIERWRIEMSKGNADPNSSNQTVSSGKDAMKLLELKDNFSNADLRRAYKNLARKYHPDKNPNGREMFEKIQKSYELLSKIELAVTEINFDDIVILLKTQNLIYRRFPDRLADQKYPVYAHLVAVLRPPAEGQATISLIDAELLEAGVELMYFTCSVSLLNSKEFVKAAGVPKLHDCIDYALRALHDSGSNTARLAEKVLEFGMKTFSLLSHFETGRDAMALQGKKFAETLYNVLALEKSIPLASEFCIETISRSSSLDTLQVMFIQAGLIWRLAPMLLAYDDTLAKTQEGQPELSEDQRRTFNQHSSNKHACLAAKALGRMSGVMYDELASPIQIELQEALGRLFTSPISKLLRNKRPQDLLNALNENVEKPTKIWNVGMRTELLGFLQKADKNRSPGSNQNELEITASFKYSNLVNELCVSGVYIRVFNKSPNTQDIDDPSVFFKSLITYLWENVICPAAESARDPADDIKNFHHDQVAECVKHLAASHDYTAHDILNVDHGIDVVFSMVHRPERFQIFSSGVELLVSFCLIPEFVSGVIEYKYKRLWILLKALCVLDHPSVPRLWAAADGFASTPDGVQALMDNGAILKLLGIVFGVTGYNIAFQNRLAANTLVSKFLWNPIKGSDAAYTLRRFLPEPVVLLLRTRAGQSSLQLLDEVTENPELIWTAEMQAELRIAVMHLLTNTDPSGPKLEPSAIEELVVSDESFRNILEVPPDFYVKYRQLENELFIGGVYIRLYLKQPTFRLSNPIFFIEKLIEYWDGSFELQVPSPNSNKQSFVGSASDDKAIVLAKEDFFSLVSSCIICVIKGEPAVMEHLLSWGVIHRYISLIQRCIVTGQRGAPLVCIFRLLRQLLEKPVAVISLSACPVDPILWLTRSLCADDAGIGNYTSGGGSVKIHTEAGLILEVLRKTFQCVSCPALPDLVGMAMSAYLPKLILDFILGGTESSLADVRNISTAKLYAVDVLKAMVAVQTEHVVILRAMYESHHAYGEYRSQSHDLFLTDSDRKDVFLLEDASEKRFAGLLEYNVSSFTSQGPLSGGEKRTSEAPNYAPIARPVSAPVTSQSVNPAFAPMARSGAPLPSSSNPVRLQQATQPAYPASNTSAAVPKAAGSTSIQTVVVKGPHGIGLDISKGPDGRCLVQRFKDMPDGAPNPAAACKPAIKPGDIISSVNGIACLTFMDAVKAIKSSTERVTLTLERDLKDID